MVRGRIGKIIPSEMEETEPQPNAADQLRLPTLDERAKLFLRAVHGERDFTNEEYATARDRILDEMANGVAAELRGHSSDRDVGGTRGGRSAFPTSATPRASPPREGVEFGAGFARFDISRSNSRKQRAVDSRLRPIANRRMFIGAAAIAATVLLLVGAYRSGLIPANQTTTESRVAVQFERIGPGDSLQRTGPADPTIQNSDIALMRETSPAVAAPLSADAIADIVRRGQALTASGQILAARSVLRQAADANSAEAALALAMTYDPVELENLGIRDVAPEIATARRWYEKAKNLGSTEAEGRLNRLAVREGQAR